MNLVSDNLPSPSNIVSVANLTIQEIISSDQNSALGRCLSRLLDGIVDEPMSAFQNFPSRD